MNVIVTLKRGCRAEIRESGPSAFRVTIYPPTTACLADPDEILVQERVQASRLVQFLADHEDY